MTGVHVVGVGMHPFGRFPELSLKDLARAATLRAVADAGIRLSDINAVYSANAVAGVLQGQEQIRGQSVLRDVGLEGIPIVNVENACASGSTALRQAVMDIRSGSSDVVLALGFEKMYINDLDTTLNALESAADLDVVNGLGLQFTAIYAMRLRKWIDAGLLEPRHLGLASVKSHANGALNPYAQHQKVFTAEEIMASRPIADPLTLLMCSSISDGSAAVILMSDKAVARFQSTRPSVVVRASKLQSGYSSAPGDPTTPTLCARAAYEEAGLGPDDINVAEVHDAMAPGELLYYEQLGFCAADEVGRFLEDGTSAISGRLPVNPSGGLSSRGHPIGATGLAQIAELTWQLRGEAGQRQVATPRIALAQNSGGWLQGEPAACNVHILERTTPW